MDPSRAAASMASSGRPSDGAGPLPDFPAGLRVLVVDDDATCLKILDQMLRKCLYDVTTCSLATAALATLREKKGEFDLVLSDVYMPDMDGFELLERIGLEMDLPVIMMSADDEKDVVMKGVTHGACDYLVKPVRIEAVKNIWQHVVRKRRNELRQLEHSGSIEENDRQKRALEEGDNSSSASEENGKNAKGKEEEEADEEREVHSTLKKPRVVWSVDLHDQFVDAVTELSVDKAVPKKILELMKVPGLTRENVASHLQKYRLYLKRKHQGRLDAPYTGASEAAFNSVGSFDGFDIQSLAVSGQLPPQNLTALYSGPRRVAATGLGMPSVDQICFLNSNGQMSNASNITPALMQQMNNKQMNVLSGPSSSTESRQLSQSQQLVQSYRNIGLPVNEGTSGFLNLPSSQRTSTSFPRGTINANMSNFLVMQMTQQGQQFSLAQQQNQIHFSMPQQPQARGQLLNEIAGEHDLRLPTAMGHQIHFSMPQQPQARGHLLNEIAGEHDSRLPIAMGHQIHFSMPQQPQVRGQLLNEIAGEHDSRLPTAMGHQTLSNELSGHVLERGGSNMNVDTSLPGGYMTASSYGAVSHPLYAEFPNSCIIESPGSCYPLASGAGTTTNLTSTGMLQEAMPLVGNVEALGNSASLKGAEDFVPNNGLFHNKNQDWKLQNINVSYQSAQQPRSKQSNVDFDSSPFAQSVDTIKDGSSRNTCTVRKEIFSVRTEIEPGKGDCIAQCNETILAENSGLKAEGISDLSCQNELINVVRKKQQEGVEQVDPGINFDDHSYNISE